MEVLQSLNIERRTMADSNIMPEKFDAFLYGSCVSRDLQELSSRRFYRRAYVARQSLISAANPPYVFEGTSELSSAWQHRMVLGDLASNLLKRLAEDAPRTDLVIWDLTDERMGVQPLSADSYGTITPDSLRSGILDAFEDQGDPIRFGTAEHLGLWSDAFERFAALLDSLGMTARTFVLEPRWTDRDSDGAGIEPEGGRPVADWARAYRPYMELIRASGIHIATLPSELVLSDPAHAWGTAPYHYVADAYHHWAREIEALLMREGGKRSMHPIPSGLRTGSGSGEIEAEGTWERTRSS